MLKFQSFGEIGDKPSLLIVHGLFGSARNWRAIARHLSAGRRVHVVDMRNHGESFWDASQTYQDMADDLATVIDHIGENMDVLGHSMGGKASMVLALTRPALVNRLIVVDIAPKAYEHDQTSNIEIMKSLPLDQFTRRSQADELLAQQVSDASLRAFFLQSVVIDATGNTWQLNLDALGENMDHIVGFAPVHGMFEGESLFLRGGKSEYVLDQDRPDIAALFPNYTLRTIENAGHWVHAEATREFMAEIKTFLG